MAHDQVMPGGGPEGPPASDTASGDVVSRRDVLKLGGLIILGTAAAEAPAAAFMGSSGAQSTTGSCSGGTAIEAFPTSPFILSPFQEALPIPTPLKPASATEVSKWASKPGPGLGQQDADGGTHQIWPSTVGLPDPLIYKIDVQLAEHSFTSSQVQPIDKNGASVKPPLSSNANPRRLPNSTIFGFNGQFPGPMIYGQYGQPSLVRFENHLDQNPKRLDVQNFGSPDREFLAHLHNAHTAPESDGNPHYRPTGYKPGQFVDNLYLNWAAGGDESEKQSFFWYHDHRMDHTGAGVYKGLAGIYPIYDPVCDNGDERTGLRLPGVPNRQTGRVDYDIPLVFYDCCLDDGVTPHKDFHNGCGETHPEWWGKTFFRHFPNHGFVGDIFTVNGKAYPVLEVKRRRYRFRLLDASISRIYRLQFMASTGGPQEARGRQGQYQLPDGQACLAMHEIATDGGLLPYPICRESVNIWPAKRREIVVDFSKYADGSPTTKGDVIYLVNTLQMTTGRKPDEALETLDDGSIAVNPNFDPNYRVPVLKIVIGANATDDSVDPGTVPELRRLAAIDLSDAALLSLPHRTFEFQRGSFGGEIQWLINGLPFDPLTPIALPKCGRPEVWTIKNGGGGWVHPIHMHMEEQRCISRNGVRVQPPSAEPTICTDEHADDYSREDVVALTPGGEVTFYRNFRTFTGKYVAHCHNLAHEDHAMMFAWTIVP